MSQNSATFLTDSSDWSALRARKLFIDLGRHEHSGTGIWVYARSILSAIANEPLPEGLRLTLSVAGGDELTEQLSELSDLQTFQVEQRHPSVGSRRFGFVTDSLSQTGDVDLYHGMANILPLFGHAKTVITLHDLLQPFPVDPPKSFYVAIRTALYRLLYRQLVRRADLIITGHAATKELLAKQYGRKERVEVLYPPLQPAFLRGEVDPASPSNVELLAFASRDPRKNVDRLLRAISTASAALDFQLTLVVNNEHTAAEYRLQVAELGLSEIVRFEVDVPSEQLPKLYQRSRAVLFPSVAEGFGYPLYEALSQGRPVLCAAGLLVEELKPFGEGAVVPCNPFNVQDIAEGIGKVLQAGQDSERMAATALEVRGLLDPKRYARRLLDLYAYLIND